MDRTLRAALLAAVIAFGALAGLGLFLGFGTTTSLVSGAVAAALATLLIVGAARRADSFHDQRVPPVEPGFPGPPDPAEPSSAAGHDAGHDADPDGGDPSGIHPDPDDER